MSNLKRVLILNRAEYWFNSVITLLGILLIAVGSVYDIFSLRCLITLLACIIIRHAGYVINAVADYELDKQCPFKSKFTDAIDHFGKRKCIAIGVGEMIMALFLLIVLAEGDRKKLLLLPLLLLLDIVNILMYNHPKIKFKSKGILNAYCMMIRGMAVPLLISWVSMDVVFSMPYILVMLGIFIEVGGGSIFFSMFDYEYDKKCDCYTFPVKYGLQSAMKTHIALRILGATLLLTGWFMFESKIPISGYILLASYLYSIIGFTRYYKKYKNDIENLFKVQEFKALSYGLMGLMGLPRTLLIVAAILKLFNY